MSAKTRQELAEDVEWMLETDHPLRVVERVGRKPATIARALYREERPDLAAPFDRLHRLERVESGWTRKSRAA